VRRDPRSALALLACAVALVATAAPAQADEPRASLPDLEDEVMCLACGVPLELATESPQANRERAFIRKLIAEGKTEDEIKDALVAEYGDDVLAVPGDSGFDLAAWLVPGLGLLIALAAIAFGVRRWRSAAAAEPPPPAERAGADPAEAERLERDIARYEL
jgi:cytochrome c-type biogenesis protein CcmH